MSDPIEPTEPVAADEPGLEPVAPDAFEAMVSANLSDVAARAADVEAEEAQDDEDHHHECDREFAPDHMAWSETAARFEGIMDLGECLVERGMGLDCDHVVNGLECPTTEMSDDEREKAEHLVACPGCLANVAVETAWDYALAQESSDVVKHLMVQRVRAASEDEKESVLLLDEIIENIMTGKHRNL